MSRMHPQAALAALLLAAIPMAQGEQRADLRSTDLSNQAPYIPPQCYTRTRDSSGVVLNPCFSCHVDTPAPSYVHDAGLQTAYAFPSYALKNRWSNLFADRIKAIAAISDAEILAYVRTDNYHAPDDGVRLTERLNKPPKDWDVDADGHWGGYLPDAYLQFDERGFDRAPDGGYTGWRAFAYYPFPGTFCPTNGSTDDVLIRLPQPFRLDRQGRPDRQVYEINLAIVEALIKRHDIPIDPVDEVKLGVDLDKSGKLGTAEKIAFDWAPLHGRVMSYVGAARTAQRGGRVHLAAGLFPEGTEFLHSVRYIDLGPDGSIEMAPRLKELRYARKARWLTYSELREAALRELKEDSEYPDRLRQLIGDPEHGLANDQGWIYQGFIEDRNGELRPQSYEEALACMGCHGGIGATTDSSFAFPRKLDASAFRGGLVPLDAARAARPARAQTQQRRV